jgi:hypothetical protein
MADIQRIRSILYAGTTRLSKDDGASTLLWIEQLCKNGELVSFKSCDMPVLEGSGLAPNSFCLTIQTPWQRERIKEHGERFRGIDATHKTTFYKNMTLFIVLVRDRWGRGVPVGWMISSDGTEATLSFFLRKLREQEPNVALKHFMTDRDQAQINALRAVLPESEIFYCLWHVASTCSGGSQLVNI